MVKNFFTRNRLIAIVVVILALLLVWWFWPSEDKNSDTITVTKGTITQEVVVTGQTKPGKNVEMSFDRSGRISVVGAEVGDRVYAGQLLASLDSRDLEAQLDQGLAELESLKKGARAEDISVSEVAVNSALDSFVQAMKDSYSQADDAVRNRTDQLFSSPRSLDALFNLDGIDYNDKLDITLRHRQIEIDFVEWELMSRNPTSKYDLSTAYDKIYNNLTYIRNYLDRLSFLVNSYVPNATYSASVLSGYRADIATGRSEVTSAMANLNTTKQAYQTAHKQLALKRAPATTEALVGKEAQLDGIRAQIAKNTITSPIDGLVTRQDAKVGESASPGVNIVTVMSASGFLIEANVPEVDIGKLLVGNQVNFTLDAFPGEDWVGKVIYIEPSETIVDGVVEYKIRASIDQNNPRMKSGLTANLTIITAKKENVLILPQYAIIENDLGSFVEKIGGQNATQTPITLGIRSQDGNVEILAGVMEGDKVRNIGLKKK